MGFETEDQARLAAELGGWSIRLADNPAEVWFLRTVVRTEPHPEKGGGVGGGAVPVGSRAPRFGVRELGR